MSRIRSIHPTIFTDEAYMSVSLAARELIKGLWCEADDNGIFPWKALTLKARIFPADNIDVAGVLGELVGAGFIQGFDIGERRFGAIRNFLKYQRPRRPSALHPLPSNAAKYLGGEPTPLPPMSAQEPPEADPIPPMSGKSPQMEDGGGNGEEERASAPPDAIWFEGQALKLNRRDFEAWERRFGEAYPDFWDELWRIDGKLAHEGLTGSKAFLKAEGWLNHGVVRWRKQRAPPNAEHLQVAS